MAVEVRSSADCELDGRAATRRFACKAGNLCRASSSSIDSRCHLQNEIDRMSLVPQQSARTGDAHKVRGVLSRTQ